MDLGIELWDSYEAVTDHVQRGIDFNEKYCHFVKERISIEYEYSGKLKKLKEKFQPKKKEEDEYKSFTGHGAFLLSLKEIESIANLHEQLSADLQSQIVANLHKLHKELRDRRKHSMSEGQHKQRELRQNLEQLEKSKRNYERSYRDLEKAEENYNRAEADINLSRAEVEKAKTLKLQRSRQCEQMKSDYAAQLQNYNSAQSNHYNVAMPKIFKSLQEIEQHRIEQLQRFMLECATLEAQTLPIIGKCLEACQEAAQSISHQKDLETVVTKHKTGYTIPGDLEFEDLSNPATLSTPGEPTNGSSRSLNKTPTQKSTLGKKGGRGLLKRFGKQITGMLKDDEEDLRKLPPSQRAQKLKHKLDELNKELQKEVNEQEGMLKMRDVFAGNIVYGDPTTLEPGLQDISKRIDALKAEINKFQGYLDDAEKSLTPQPKRKTAHEHNGDSGSLASQSASDASEQQQPSQQSHNDSFDETYEAPYENSQALGTCKALYPFPASADGSISMQQDEQFTITEKDAGDGWTRVRNETSQLEGYVPSSYIEVVQWYETV